MKALKKYVSVYRLMWKQVTDYRFEFLAELVCTFIPVIALYYLWSDIYIAENSIKGMKFGEMFLYIVLARFISMIITPNFIFEIMGDIQSGEIQHFICKPINYIRYSFVKYIAEKSRSMLFCSIIYIVIFAFLFKGKIFYGSGVDIILFFVEVMVAMVFYFQIAMVIGLLSFWIYEISSWYYTLTFAIEFLAGGLFPLTLLPESFSNICRFMPFQYMIYFPARTLLMGTDRTEVIRYFYVIVPWIVGLGILLEVLWKNGLKHYELIGG